MRLVCPLYVRLIRPNSDEPSTASDPSGTNAVIPVTNGEVREYLVVMVRESADQWNATHRASVILRSGETIPPLAPSGRLGRLVRVSDRPISDSRS
jgi:hypothetical protein